MSSIHQIIPTEKPAAPIKRGAEGPLLCKACLAQITWRGEAVEVQGRHWHVFTNPHGITFEVACYRSAPGCVETGLPTMEYTWFKNYFWQIVLCSNCSVHLGWLYSQGDGGFYGLIPGRLTAGRS